MTIPSRRVSSECLEDREESVSKMTRSDREEWRCPWKDVSLMSSYSSGSSEMRPEYSDGEGCVSWWPITTERQNCLKLSLEGAVQKA